MHSSYPRHAGKRALAVLGAAALGVGAFALPAAAQAPVPTDVALDVPSSIPADDSETAGSIDIEFDADFTPADHEVTALLDFESELIRIAPGTTDDGFCGMHATIPGLYCASESTDGSIHWEFGVNAEWGTPPGDYPYAFEVEVDGETVATIEGSMQVHNPGEAGLTRPYLHGDAAFDGVEPGGTVDLAPEFLQDTALTDDAAAVVVTVWAPQYLPHGLAAPSADYDNCIVDEGVSVTCVVTDFEDLAGTAFTFTDPIRYTVDEHAPGPFDVCSCAYEVYTLDGERLDERFGGVFWDEGSGDLFGLRAVSDPEGEFGDQYEGYIEIATTANPFDLAVSDVNVKGAKGDEVTVTVPVQNLGPADAASFFDGPGSYGIIGSLPKGLELVEADVSDDDSIFCMEPFDSYADSFPKADLEKADFVCLFWSLDAGASFDFEFTVKVTDPNAKGRGSLQVAALDHHGYPGIADKDAKNDKADLTFGGTGSGQLPKTGASLTMVIGAAALILVVGAVLLVVTARRRKAVDAQ